MMQEISGQVCRSIQCLFRHISHSHVLPLCPVRCLSWTAVVEHEHYIVSNLQIDLPIVIDHYFSFLSSQKDQIPSLSY